MKFFIEGNGERIEQALEIFCQVTEEEWENVALQKKDKLIMKIGQYMPVKADINMPENISTAYYKEGNGMVFVFNFYVPKLMRGFSMMMRKKMISALKEYFKEVGVEVEVKFMGWD